MLSARCWQMTVNKRVDGRHLDAVEAQSITVLQGCVKTTTHTCRGTTVLRATPVVGLGNTVRDRCIPCLNVRTALTSDSLINMAHKAFQTLPVIPDTPEDVTFDYELTTDDVLYPVGFQFSALAGSWPSNVNPVDVKDVFLSALLSLASTSANKVPIPFAKLADTKASIITANITLKSKGKPFIAHLVFKDSEVACLIAMLLEHLTAISVPAHAVSSAAAAAAVPQHPTQLAVKAIVPLGSPVSLLVAQNYNVLHIYPVQSLGPRVLSLAISAAGHRDGWLTEFVSLDYGQSPSLAAHVIDHFTYPRGFFRAVIKCNAACHPVPSGLVIDTSKFRFKQGSKGSEFALPSRESYSVRARFGVAPSKAAQAAADQPEQIETSMAGSKRFHMEGIDDVSGSTDLR